MLLKSARDARPPGKRAARSASAALPRGRVPEPIQPDPMNKNLMRKSSLAGESKPMPRPDPAEDPVRRHTQTIDLLMARLERESEQREEMWATIRELELSRSVGASGDPAVAANAIRMLRYRSMVREIVPRGAVVAVASEGEASWLDLPSRTAWHFPRDASGNATQGPLSCGLSALVHLEALRGAGAGFLVVPAAFAPVLDRLPEFRLHLESRFQRLRSDDVATVYSLAIAPGECTAAGDGGLARLISECEDRIGREPSVLDWDTGLGIAAALPRRNVFAPPAGGAGLPYLEGSVDVVALRSTAPPDMAEARRVAAVAVVRCAVASRAVEVEWRSAPAAPAYPSSSIIIPTYNGWKLVKDCLVALGETLPSNADVEIVVVDDGSSDGTMDRLAEWSRREPRLRPVACPRNGGFIAACNRGAKSATGEVLVFLNNDTLPLPNWLEPLLRGMRDLPDAGAVGGKLIYPDGRLQEAGGIIFSDASGANFGRNDTRPDAPLYNFVRPVDYCSGALLATRRALFEELGGFDVYYSPAYYEDTDYCFRVRNRGLRVYYQPESQIVHLEGATSGTDLGSGVKACQVVNRGRFTQRWQAALSRQPTAPNRWDFGVMHGLSIGGNLIGTEVA